MVQVIADSSLRPRKEPPMVNQKLRRNLAQESALAERFPGNPETEQS
jgi:hypothetical protein